jgi:hypothetical protein
MSRKPSPRRTRAAAEEGSSWNDEALALAKSNPGSAGALAITPHDHLVSVLQKFSGLACRQRYGLRPPPGELEQTSAGIFPGT